MSERFLSDKAVTADATSVTVHVQARGFASNASITGLTKDSFCAAYWRQGGSATSIALQNLASVTAAHSAGGFIEMSGTILCGVYRLDTPDAMWVRNADWAVLQVWRDGLQPWTERFAITSGTTFASCVLHQIIEDCGSYTLQQAMSVILSTTAGASGTSGTVRYSPNGCAVRATATIDSSDNRVVVVLTPSAGA